MVIDRLPGLLGRSRLRTSRRNGRLHASNYTHCWPHASDYTGCISDIILSRPLASDEDKDERVGQLRSSILVNAKRSPIPGRDGDALVEIKGPEHAPRLRNLRLTPIPGIRMCDSIGLLFPRLT
jgi:hypothetical protein